MSEVEFVKRGKPVWHARDARGGGAQAPGATPGSRARRLGGAAWKSEQRPWTRTTLGTAPGFVDSWGCEDVVLAGRVNIVPVAYPPEFRRGVIAVALRGEQSRAQVAPASGSPSPALPGGWRSRTGRTHAQRVASSLTRRSAMRARSVSCVAGSSMSSKRTKSCAGRPPTSPATSSPNDLPAGRCLGREQDPRRGDLPGARVLQAGARHMARPTDHRPGSGRRAPDQRGHRHPQRRPGVWVPVHRRRVARSERSWPARTACTGCAPRRGCSRCTPRSVGPPGGSATSAPPPTRTPRDTKPGVRLTGLTSLTASGIPVTGG